jgi:hypothetical protein
VHRRIVHKKILPQEAAMNKISAATVVLVLALSAFLLGASAIAQQATPPSSSAMSQDQAVPPQATPSDPSGSKTFTGKIVKSGEQLVLTDATGKQVYQLDDQIKAKEFLNKNVKVTGILDGSTSMIHVTAIDPV